MGDHRNSTKQKILRRIGAIGPGQRMFMVPGQDYQALMELLEKPAKINPGLKKLFAKTAPWKKP